MPMSNETVPNKPLNGEELKQVILDNLKQVLDNDCFFSRTVSYTRCAFSFVVTVHGGGLEKVEARSRVKKEGPIEGEAPLENPPDDAQFAALQREVKVESPNLTRIHHGLPIKASKKLPPATPEDPFPAFQDQSITYEPGDHPPLPVPNDTDVTEREAAKLRINRSPAAMARQAMYDREDKKPGL